MSEHIENGLKYLDDGKINGAIAAFEKAIEVEPENVDGHYGLAEAVSLTGDQDRALQLFRKAIAIKPKGRGLALLAKILLERDELSEVPALLANAMDEDPSDPLSYFLSAEIAIRKEDYFAADSLLKKAVRRGAEVPATQIFGFYHQWVGRMSDEGRTSEVLEVVGRAADYYRESPHLMLLSAGLAERHGDIKLAIERYKKAAAALPDGKLRVDTLEKIARLA